MRDHRTLRSPFVVTVAAAATLAAASLVAGCGAAVSAQTCDGGACPDSAQPDGCPTSPPSGACSTAGIMCPYTGNPQRDSCGDRLFYVRCTDSMQWQALPSSCNPPPPYCPPTTPTQGAPCGPPVVGYPCRYNVDTPCGVLPITASCTASGWSLTAISCNPPPPQPDAGPEAGADASDDASDDGG